VVSDLRWDAAVLVIFDYWTDKQPGNLTLITIVNWIFTDRFNFWFNDDSNELHLLT